MLTINSLIENKPLLFDGAMGTSIQKLGLGELEPLELLSVKYPEELIKIHEDYFKAGANIIETNTFGASRPRLKLHNLEDKVEEINKSSARFSLSCRSENTFICGSVGPTGLLIEPYGGTKKATVKNYFKEQIGFLLKEGVDIVLIETMISLDEALLALEASKDLGTNMTGITMTFEIGNAGISTSFGDSSIDVCRRLEESGANFIGSNCGQGFEKMLLLVAKELRV